jgi:hypothetical protein
MSTSVQVLVDLQSSPPTDWVHGPLAEEWRAAAGKPVHGGVTGRLPYINPGLETVLYRRDGVRTVRWHNAAPSPPPLRDGVQLVAMELLLLPFRYPFPNALLILHFTIETGQAPADLQQSLNHLTNHNPRHEGGSRAWVDRLVEPWASINARHRRGQHVTLLTRSGQAWPETTAAAKSGSDATNEWLFTLATSGRYRPDPGSIKDGDIQGGEVHRIWMSDRLRGAVSRDGFVMVGLNEDAGGSRGRYGFDYDGAQFFARGLYSDVLALSTMQRVALDALEHDLARLYPHRPSPSELFALENELSLFRTLIWRKDFAPQGSQDEVLVQLQESQGLSGRESNLSRNVAEVSGRALRVEQNTIAALLRLLTLIGIVWGFVWTWLSDSEVTWRFWVLGLTLALVLTIMALHPGLRATLGLSKRRQPLTSMHITFE